MYRPEVGGVSRSNPPRDADSSIRGLTQDYCTAFNTGNYDHAAALFAGDGVFMPPYKDSFQGAKIIERALRNMGESGYQDLRLQTTRVESDGEMAAELGSYVVTIHSGGLRLTDHGKYLRTWRRLGIWLITADCWSSSLQLSEYLRVPPDAKVA